MLRSFLEKGRAESKQEHFDLAEVQYKKAVDLSESVYGKGSPESGAGAHGVAWLGHEKRLES